MKARIYIRAFTGCGSFTMKIDRINTLKITGNAAVKSALGAIPKGGKVEARVVERLDGGKAVLELAGKKITAEFLKGVPGDARFELVLESKRGNQFLFRLAGGGRAVRLTAELDPFLAGGAARLKEQVPRLKAFLDGPGGIFSLNRHLAGLHGGGGSDPLTNFVNALMVSGMKPERLSVFSYLLTRRRCINSERFGSIARLLSANIDAGDQLHDIPADEQQLGEWVRDFIRDVGDCLDDESNRRQFREFMESLSGSRDADYVAPREYSVPFFDGERFTELKVLEEGAFIVCAAEFSRLGPVEVVGSDAGGHISLSIFCENDKSVEILKQDLHDLQMSLKDARGGVDVRVRGMAEARKLACDAVRALLDEASREYRA